MEEYNLDDLDYKILNLISNDTRISFLEVARLCNVSGAAVHQRVQKMMTNEIINGSQFNLNLSAIGYQTCAFLSLHFRDTEDLDEIAEKLRSIDEIVECHSITGEFDFLVKIYTLDNSHLYEIIRRKIKPMGLIKTETLISYKESFRRQMVFKRE